ncbi:nuclear transport factor 2 family protein [Catenovulum sp. SM1970]|uniref:nuclear transport factor 2 family protein n=1 Tax=Marinifaba aquimaris TaxID=2741323 RepID=UPI001571F763|nr:nuclear transport factor 2 family protein [Marinifaba aquimaris]NTS78492.1 nuclear transport factor 2 family protein [Marinifaba aquimaris]
MDNTIKQQLIETYINAYNRFEIDKMLTVLTDDVTFENLDNDTVTAKADNKAEFAELAQQAKVAFAEREQKIMAIEHLDNLSIIAINYSGTLAIDLSNGLNAGETIILTGQSEFKFKNGFISSIRDIS